MPIMDYIFASTELYDQSILWQYTNCVYHSVLLFGSNEMGSRTVLVLSMTCAIELFASMYNANIFGEMMGLVSDLSKRDIEFEEQQDTCNTGKIQ